MKHTCDIPILPCIDNCGHKEITPLLEVDGTLKNCVPFPPVIENCRFPPRGLIQVVSTGTQSEVLLLSGIVVCITGCGQTGAKYPV